MVFKMCCVKIFMTLFLTFSTPQVYTPRLTNCLSIKPANLDKVQLDLDEKSHQHVAFWPRGSSARVPVSQLEGFPTEWQREKHFLVQSLGWRSPEILGGVEHPGRPKPCWDAIQ